MIGSMAAEKYEFVGELMNTSKPGEISGILQSSLKSSQNNIAFNAYIYGDINRANVELKMIVNDQEYTIKIEGTPNSIIIDTYIFKHMLFNAYVSILYTILYYKCNNVQILTHTHGYTPVRTTQHCQYW